MECLFYWADDDDLKYGLCPRKNKPNFQISVDGKEMLCLADINIIDYIFGKRKNHYRGK